MCGVYVCLNVLWYLCGWCMSLLVVFVCVIDPPNSNSKLTAMTKKSCFKIADYQK